MYQNFSDRDVECGKIYEILEAGRLEPTAKKLQEQHIYVVKSNAILAKIDKVTPCR